MPDPNNDKNNTATPQAAPLNDAPVADAAQAASGSSTEASVNKDPLALRQALDKMRPTFAVFPMADLLPVRLDPPTAAMSVLNHVDDFAPYLPRIALLAEVNQFWIANIELLAMALIEADSHTKVASKLPPEVMETYREATVLRDETREEALILHRRGLLPRGSLDSVSGDRGYRNTAVELTALGNVLRDNWSAIASKTAISIQEVDRCNLLAQSLFRNAEDRLQRASVPAHMSLVRQQAYTLLILAYDELRRCISFLDPEALEVVAPTLFQGRGRKPGTGAAETPATPSAPQPQTPTQEAEIEAQIQQELSGGADSTLAAPNNPAASAASNPSDPVQRAQAIAADTTAKPSKSPFVG